MALRHRKVSIPGRHLVLAYHHLLIRSLHLVGGELAHAEHGGGERGLQAQLAGLQFAEAVVARLEVGAVCQLGTRFILKMKPVCLDLLLSLRMLVTGNIQ